MREYRFAKMANEINRKGVVFVAEDEVDEVLLRKSKATKGQVGNVRYI